MEEPKKLAIGIDLGSSDSYVAYINNGTIDIVQNETSQRRTPSLVGFTERERLLGDSALSQIKSIVKNTCRNFKHYLGQELESASMKNEKFWSTCELRGDENNYVGCCVQYKGESQVFSATAITAMFLTKLKDITEAWCNGTVTGVVIGVPSYFTAFQRAAILDAGKIAGLEVLRVMNEHTATALEFGYWRAGSFDMEKPTTVAFCQMGHAVFSVAIVQFVRGKLCVLCEKSDKVGGRDMDECLIRTFAKQFEKKTGCNVLSNKKALFKLEDAVTKTKKILSANSESTISCECLMEDYDFGSSIDRADFLEMCQPMMKKVSDVLEAAKAAAGIPVSSIDAVEMCGGSSRVPWVKEMCSKAFDGKELSTTMNADECVARGCALQAAMLSPFYKVREFRIEDTSPFPVCLGWSRAQPPPSNGDRENGHSSKQEQMTEKSLVVFPGNSLMNLRKMLVFFRKEAFEVKAMYSDDGALGPGMPRNLGSYRIELPAHTEEQKVKVSAALTLHGTFVIEGAHMLSDLEPEDTEVTPRKSALVAEGQQQNGRAPSPAARDGEEVAGRKNSEIDERDASKDTSQQAGREGERGAEEGGGERSGGARGGRKQLKRTNLAVIPSGCPGLDDAEIKRRRGQEVQMITEMNEIVDTNACRNDLEAYILTMRSGLGDGGKLCAFVEEAERGRLTEALTRAEDWLYDHMDDAKQVFIDKMAELMALCNSADERCKEHDRRPDLAAILEQNATSLKATAQGPAAKRKHLDVAKLRSLEVACDEALAWIADMRRKQRRVPKHEDPVLLCADIASKNEALSKLAQAALSESEIVSETQQDVGAAAPEKSLETSGPRRERKSGPDGRRPVAMEVE